MNIGYSRNSVRVEFVLMSRVGCAVSLQDAVQGKYSHFMLNMSYACRQWKQQKSTKPKIKVFTLTRFDLGTSS